MIRSNRRQPMMTSIRLLLLKITLSPGVMRRRWSVMAGKFRNRRRATRSIRPLVMRRRWRRMVTFLLSMLEKTLTLNGPLPLPRWLRGKVKTVLKGQILELTPIRRNFLSSKNRQFRLNSFRSKSCVRPSSKLNLVVVLLPRRFLTQNLF